MLNIVLFGPPGAGKGTQATRLEKKFNLQHLSTGDLLRSQLKEKTELGLKAQSYMDKGELVPDEIIIGMVRSKLENAGDSNGFIFDGFPRTTEQALALDELLAENDSFIAGMLSLEVSKQELIDRLVKRGKDSGRTDDQDTEIIENRIKVYHNETAPLIDYYKAQNKFTAVEGIGTIEEIFERLSGIIGNIKENTEQTDDDDKEEKDDEKKAENAIVKVEKPDKKKMKGEKKKKLTKIEIEIGDILIKNGSLHIEIGDFELFRESDVEVEIGNISIDGAEVSVDIGDFEMQS